MRPAKPQPSWLHLLLVRFIIILFFPYIFLKVILRLAFNYSLLGIALLTPADWTEEEEEMLRKANIVACGADAAAQLLRHDMRKARFDDAQFDLVFLDPPYGKGLAEAVLPALHAHLTDNAIVVIEEAKRSVVTVSENYREAERRAKGDTQLIFLTPA